MPKFSPTIKMRKFAGIQIPHASTKAVRGRAHGVYFHWRGKWRFIAIRGFYITCDGVDIDDHRGANEIHEFK